VMCPCRHRGCGPRSPATRRLRRQGSPAPCPRKSLPPLLERRPVPRHAAPSPSPPPTHGRGGRSHLAPRVVPAAATPSPPARCIGCTRRRVFPRTTRGRSLLRGTSRRFHLAAASSHSPSLSLLSRAIAANRTFS